MGFGADVKKWTDTTSANFDQGLGEVLVELGDRLVDRTPYRTGHAKLGWGLTFGEDNGKENPGTDSPDGTDAKGRIRTAAENAKAGTDAYLTNHVSYIVELENGRSDQAPEGMAGVTAAEFGDIVNTTFKQT